MSEIEWNVVPGDERRTVNVDVSSEDWAPLRALFFSVPESRYPRLIEASLAGVGATFDEVGVTFPGDLDPGDDSVPAGSVEVFDPVAEAVIPSSTFLRVLLKVAQESLRIRDQRSRISDGDAEALQSQIAALDRHLNG